MHFGTAQWAAKRLTTDHAACQMGRADRLQRHVCALCLPHALSLSLSHCLSVLVMVACRDTQIKLSNLHDIYYTKAAPQRNYREVEH